MRKKIALNSVTLRLRKQPIVYISGKVTGLLPSEVREKFNRQEKALKELGCAVFNPSKAITEADCDWKMAMRVCVAVLPICDYIFMLPDWEDSKGAIEEHRIATLLGIQVLHSVVKNNHQF